MLVEVSKVELGYDAVLAVIQDGVTVNEAVAGGAVACVAPGGQGRIAIRVATHFEVQCIPGAK